MGYQSDVGAYCLRYGLPKSCGSILFEIWLPRVIWVHTVLDIGYQSDVGPYCLRYWLPKSCGSILFEILATKVIWVHTV